MNENLRIDYETSWKLIEYNMKTSLQILLGFASFIGVISIAYQMFVNLYPAWKFNWFLASLIVVSFVLVLLWLIFFKIYTFLTHVYATRCMEIEAICDMRSYWRGYLLNGELCKDFDEWKKNNVFADKDLEQVKKAINKIKNDSVILLQVVKQKYLDLERQGNKKIFKIFLKYSTPHAGRIIAEYTIFAAIIWLFFCGILYFWK